MYNTENLKSRAQYYITFLQVAILEKQNEHELGSESELKLSMALSVVGRNFMQRP
jgi:hypothetical protein